MGGTREKRTEFHQQRVPLQRRPRKHLDGHGSALGSSLGRQAGEEEADRLGLGREGVDLSRNLGDEPGDHLERGRADASSVDRLGVFG